MKLNIISDLHCGFNQENDTVEWNGAGISNKDKKSAIFTLNKIIRICKNNKENINKSIINLQNKSVELFFLLHNSIRNINDIINIIKKGINYIKIGDYEVFDDILNVNDDIDIINSILETINKDYYVNTFIIRYCLNYIAHCFIPEKLEPADYLIVAGDLGLDDTYQKVYEDLKKRTEGKFRDIFYIKGNHDYWWFPNKNRTHKQRPENINFDHRYFEKEIDEYLFLGCTMWAPVRSMNVYNVQVMNDYRYIPGLSNKFIPDSTNLMTNIYKEESNWLRTEVNKNKDKKIIIFTHHMPRRELVDNDFKDSKVNDAYAVMDRSCDDIKPLVWIHGHTHKFDDRIINGVRYIRNPIGYRAHYGYVTSEVNPAHWYNTVIEV